MKTLLALEEAAQFGLALVALYLQPLSLPGWLWLPLLLSPDISMLGYLVSPRAGAALYNGGHHKGLALLVAAAGWAFHLPGLLLAGGVLFAHACLDRMLGYGLKYRDSFGHTHLGTIGKSGV